MTLSDLVFLQLLVQLNLRLCVTHQHIYGHLFNMMFKRNVLEEYLQDMIV